MSLRIKITGFILAIAVLSVSLFWYLSLIEMGQMNTATESVLTHTHTRPFYLAISIAIIGGLWVSNFITSIIQKRIKVEQLLLESKKRYETLYIASSEAIMILEPNGKFINGNPATIKLFGCKNENEFITHTPSDLSPKYQEDGSESGKKAGEMMNIALKKGSHTFEWKHKKCGGDEFYANVLLTKMEIGDGIVLQATVRDITEKKILEERLKNDRIYNRTLFETSPVGLALSKMDGTLVDINQTYADIIGYSIKEALQLTYWDITPKKYKEQEKIQLELLRTTGRYGPYEKEYITKNSTLIPVQLVGSIVKIDGEEFIWSSVEDITNRKQTEVKLQRMQELLDDTGSLTHAGGWEIDLETQKITWTKEVFSIHEVDDDFVPTLKKGIKFYTPESRPIIQDAIDRAIKQGKSFDVKLQIITAKKNRRLVHVIGSAVKHDGKIVAIRGMFQDITDSERTKEEIYALSKFPSENPNPVLRVTKDGKIIYSNKASAELLKIWGTTLSQVIPLKWRKIIKQSMKTGKVILEEELIGDITFSFNVFPVKRTNYVNIYAKNITNRKHAEQKLLEEAINTKKFKHALDSTKIATIITTPEPAIIYINPAWEDLTGYTLKEAKGQNPRILQSGKTPKTMYPIMWNTIEKGKEFHTDEIINKRKDGTEYNAELRVYPIMQDDKVQFYVGMQTDITNRVRGETAKTEFMSLASHQLRTPLTAIRWGLNLITQKGKLNAKQADILKDTHSATERMSETIDIMLKLSRIESGQMPVSKKNINLCKIFRDLKEQSISAAEQKNQKCEFKCTKNIYAVTDASILREILSNLLSNAIKYTPTNGKIGFSAKPIGKTMRISITDNGYGIPKKEQQKVFSKFFRATNVVDTIPDGTGLGLYLVYALTKLIGGSVTFSSKENSGSTFTVSIPITSTRNGKKNSHR